MLGSTSSIQIKHIFGFKPDTKGSVFHVDDTKIIYTAGHNVVIYSKEDHLMQFFPGLDVSQEITSIVISPLRRHLAVAEKAEPAVITVYDTHTQRKKRMMNTPDCQSNQYVSMAFAPGQENKYLIAMGGPPDWTLVYWHWEKPRVVSSIQVSAGNPVHEVSFNILDHNLGIVATGEDVFRWYKVVDEEFKALTTDIHNKDSEVSSNFLCHTWLKDGRLIVGNDKGQIIILDSNCEYLGFMKVELEDFQVTRLILSEAGFVAGGSDGRVAVYWSTEEEEVPAFKLKRVIELDKKLCNNSKIKGISLSSQTEEQLVMTTENSQIFQVDFNGDSEEPKPLSHLFHHGTVTGMDVCVRKPLLVTCGADHSVKIWNYQEKTLEVSATFTEEPFSVAFHPSGLHIVVGFADKLRIMNVFKSTIKAFKDISIRACAEVKFSNGGQMFAATNGSYIKVFNFYTGESPSHLEFKGHSGRVKALTWNEDDTNFVSAGMDGAVYEWRLNSRNSGTHPQENHQKGVVYSSLILAENSSGEGKSIYAVGNDKLLKEFIESNETRRLDTGAMLSQLCLSNSGKILFAGVSDPQKTGSVRCYKFSPLTGDYSEFQAHQKGIERMRVSYDDCFLFTAGQDGSVIIWEIKDKDIRALRREKESIGLPLSEEILITKAEIEELHQQIENQRTNKRESVTNFKMKYELTLQDKTDYIEKLREQLINDAQQDKNKYDSLVESKRDMEKHYEEKINNLKEQYQLEKQGIETEQQQELMIEVTRYHELTRDKEQESRTAEDTIQNLQKQHQQQIETQCREFEQQLQEEKEEILNLQRENEQQKKKFALIEEFLLGENQEEVKESEVRNEVDIRKIKENSLKAKGKLSMARRKEASLQADKDRLEDDLKSKKEEYRQQGEQIERLTKRKKELQEVIQEKDSEIGDRERKIYELKQKNQNLEKFKFVLDYKIRELKQEMGPRDKEIADMKEKTSNMDKELKYYSSLNESLGGYMEELSNKQEKMQKEINSQRDKIRQAETQIKAMKDGIYDCAQSIQDYRKLKELILKLFNNFVKTEGRGQEQETEKEFARQCEYLQNSIDTLRKKLKEATERNQKNNMQMMDVNASLIKELDQLRKQRDSLRQFKKQYELLTQNSQPRRSHREEKNLKIVEKQKEEIRDLRKRIHELENARPPSQGRLPPLDASSNEQD